MRSSRRLLLALSVAAVVPGIARADVHGWTLCTPSAFHSCHSVSIGTTPIMVGSTRVGTGITVTVTNLQGSGFASDNTIISGLYRVFFAGRNMGSMVGAFPVLVPAVMTGPGASGSTGWTMEAGSQNGTQTVGFTDTQTGGNDLIGGCASGPLYFGLLQTSANTCGAGAMAIFSFTSGSIFDAGQMETAFIAAAGPFDQFDFCFSNPAAAPDPGIPACDVQDEFVTTVTPEPVTIALMGTGLFGIGGARLRRRRKTEGQA